MAITGSISGLATDIFENELDSTGVTLSSVSGWLNENFGLLNNYLYTSLSGSGDSVSGMGLEERDIYKEMYLYHYYTKQARNTLRGIANDTNGNITSVRDGEQTITFVNKNEVSKVYRGLAQDSYDKMLRLVQSYNSYQAAPRQVGGIESLVQPTGNSYN
jgi:hypothetical protein|tara:strand:- start:2130 stop:2609 length:480 start_codon:yes stop_codon:yes gene_type:complete